MNKGFTLIEILIVIVVIGILSSFILVGMSSISGSANIAKGQAYANSLRNSLLMDLVSEWKFDGNANDSWGTNNGTVFGATLISSGCMKGSCYSFDGSDDYIEINDNPRLKMLTGGTISAWIYPETLGEQSWGAIMDRSTSSGGLNGFAFVLTSGNRLYFQINNGTAMYSSSNTITLNKWQLVAVTFNNSGRNFYINGLNVTASGGDQILLPPDNVHVVRIGNRSYATDITFDGYIDEVLMYDKVLSVFQIQEKYYSGLNRLLVSDKINIAEYNKRLALNE